MSCLQKYQMTMLVKAGCVRMAVLVCMCECLWAAVNVRLASHVLRNEIYHVLMLSELGVRPWMEEPWTHFYRRGRTIEVWVGKRIQFSTLLRSVVEVYELELGRHKSFSLTAGTIRPCRRISFSCRWFVPYIRWVLFLRYHKGNKRAPCKAVFARFNDKLDCTVRVAMVTIKKTLIFSWTLLLLTESTLFCKC